MPAPRSGPAGPDLLLTTLAVVAGARTIAVVLFGRGNDAATGATAVHRFQGAVIASTTDTSTQAAMPQATIDCGDAIDHGVPPGRARRAIALTAAPVITCATEPS